MAVTVCSCLSTMEQCNTCLLPNSVKFILDDDLPISPTSNPPFPFSNFDWTLFDKEVTAHLPVYARPAFIRVTKEIPMTSTFKQQKGVLSKDGFDPSLIQEHSDVVYYYNAKEHTVTKLEQALFEQIQTGKVQV